MLETYNSLDEMWLAMLDDLFTHGERHRDTLEIIGWSGRLVDCERTFLTNSRRAASPEYACAELLWYLSRTSSIAALLPYAPQYTKFASSDGIAYGAYGKRIARNLEWTTDGVQEGDALEMVTKLLKEKPDTRQAVIALWRPSDLSAALSNESPPDMPCTLSLTFELREDTLHLAVTMRSNDVHLGTPYDIFCFTCLQRLVADRLGVKCGEYIHTAVSLHLYDRNAIAAREALTTTYSADTHGWKTRSDKSDEQSAVLVERHMRKDSNYETEWQWPTRNTFLWDAVACVAPRWDRKLEIYSPSLRTALAQVRKST